MPTFNRIYIAGGSGSGKSTLAKRLGEQLGLRIVHLDDIQFEKKFTIIRPKDKRKQLLKEFIRKNKRWIIEGSQTSWTEYAVASADLIIELRTAKHLTALRVVRRWFNRKFGTNEHKETLGGLRDLLLYIWRFDHPKHVYAQEYEQLMAHAKGRRMVLRSKKDVELLVSELS